MCFQFQSYYNNMIHFKELLWNLPRKIRNTWTRPNVFRLVLSTMACPFTSLNCSNVYELIQGIFKTAAAFCVFMHVVPLHWDQFKLPLMSSICSVGKGCWRRLQMQWSLSAFQQPHLLQVSFYMKVAPSIHLFIWFLHHTLHEWARNGS